MNPIDHRPLSITVGATYSGRIVEALPELVVQAGFYHTFRTWLLTAERDAPAGVRLALGPDEAQHLTIGIGPDEALALGQALVALVEADRPRSLVSRVCRKAAAAVLCLFPIGHP